MDAWLTVVGAPDPVVPAVTRGLEERGVRLHRREDDDAVRPRRGVVAFTGATAEVVAFLRDVAGGQDRVLALSMGGPVGDFGWELLAAGASDVFGWGEPEASAGHVVERLRRWHRIDELLDCRHVRDHLVGGSAPWRAVVREAVEAAAFTTAAVLITGESGTGKERVAQLVHELDPRPAKKKLVVLDCSTVIPSLSGSEFFGHEKGAFTGASTPREGAFELADGGTLFLDEVGELPVALQAELLRVIQEGTFKRVGSNTWRHSRFRLVCATNRDLDADQANGAFRNDLYYRIAGCRLHLPPLRERTDDVIPLFRHFFRQVHPDRQPPELDPAVRNLLLRRAYPGNVRDLRSLVLRIAHRHVGDGIVTVGDVPEQERPGPAPSSAWSEALVRDIRRALAEGATLDDIAAVADDVVGRFRAAGDGPPPVTPRPGAADPTARIYRSRGRNGTAGVRAGAGAVPRG